LKDISASGSKRLYVGISILALLAGGGIYLFLRPGEFVFHHWLGAIGLEELFTPNGSSDNPIGNRLPNWILYSLPDGLWAFAYTFLIMGIWQGSPSPVRYFWFATIPVLVLGFEGLQGLEIIHGTFCFQDLVLDLSGIVIGIYCRQILK